jgi:hypothetical protein
VMLSAASACRFGMSGTSAASAISPSRADLRRSRKTSFAGGYSRLSAESWPSGCGCEGRPLGDGEPLCLDGTWRLDGGPANLHSRNRIGRSHLPEAAADRHPGFRSPSNRA